MSIPVTRLGRPYLIINLVRKRILSISKEENSSIKNYHYRIKGQLEGKDTITNMKQVENGQSLLRLATVVVVVVLITMVEPMTSQPTDRNTTLMRYFCSQYRGTNEEDFLSNLNSTLTKLRRQLTTNGYATARTLFNGESVWGRAMCRGYLSIPDCLDCFDYAVERMKPCWPGNGATVVYSDCDVRYENGNFFTDANYRPSVVVCDSDNITSPQPIEFIKAAKKLLRDLIVATPRASNFYAASTRRQGDGNATVHAIAQCNLNLSQSVCSECLELRFLSLIDCFPTITGRATDDGCFMRYSRTPFFGQNQTTDISSLLWDDDLNKKRSIIGGVVGGVSFLLILLAIFLWCGRLKKIGIDQQGYYSYKQLQLATNNFSEENMIGKGGFGEVYKVIEARVGFIP